MNRPLTPVVKHLLIINGIFYLAMLLMEAAGIDLTSILGLHFMASPHFRPYQFLTYMFMHGGLTHLLFNMFALWMFGVTLEYVWGGRRFLVYYLVTGVGAALLHTAVQYAILHGVLTDFKAFVNTPTPDAYYAFIEAHVRRPVSAVYDFYNLWAASPDDASMASQAVRQLHEYIQYQVNIPTVGASGAVFGLLLAFGMLFPNAELMLLFPPIPMRAKWFVMICGAVELILGIAQPGSSVAHIAHVGGMLFGFLLIRYWQRDRSRFY
ncbi:MAG: rhomboid family intramembrane serine protease [Bacteroidales bacterium]|nr:rhomboid family intramembrane serine protease [Bacteroidales bacterium]